MDEVNATIAASAAQEELVDQPKVVPGVLRVSGPFTVEGVQPAEESLDLESPIGGEPEDAGDLRGFRKPRRSGADEPANAEAYLDKMIRLLRRTACASRTTRCSSSPGWSRCAHSVLHAEGEWGDDSGAVAAWRSSFGPQYGPITAKQVEDCSARGVPPRLRRPGVRRLHHRRRGAGGDPGRPQPARALPPGPHPPRRERWATCSRTRRAASCSPCSGCRASSWSQPATASGWSRWRAWTSTTRSPTPSSATDADKVAAWFLDSDYDGRTFCITQAFFPDAVRLGEAGPRAQVGGGRRTASPRSPARASLPFAAGQARADRGQGDRPARERGDAGDEAGSGRRTDAIEQ